jgi:hypothetical protein
MRFRIDGVRRRVRLLQSVSSRSSSDDGRGFFPGAVGSARWQPNGDALVDWGNSGRITQVSRRGTVRLSFQLEHWTYRAVRDYWRGSPGGRPAIAIRPRPGLAVDVFASWNGATGIRRWQVLAGASDESLQPLGHTYRWVDLETRMRVHTGASLLAVEALDRRGRVLGRSLPVRRD